LYTKEASRLVGKEVDKEPMKATNNDVQKKNKAEGQPGTNGIKDGKGSRVILSRWQIWGGLAKVKTGFRPGLSLHTNHSR
jgi:hypothetical protein